MFTDAEKAGKLYCDNIATLATYIYLNRTVKRLKIIGGHIMLGWTVYPVR